MKLLIIEDEEKLVKRIAEGLKGEGYSVEVRLNGLKGQEYIEDNFETLDLVILDWMLPVKSGLEVCKELRGEGINVPILILTAKSSTESKIEGLDAGADDYLVKPFAFEELLARIRTLLRRPNQVLGDQIKIGNLMLDQPERKAFCAGKELILTQKEYGLLEYFMRNPNQVLTRDQILEKLWGESDYLSNVVDVHVKNLRKKIESLDDTQILATIRGLGYKLKV